MLLDGALGSQLQNGRNTKRIGYARVSSAEQNLDLQLNALESARCDRIFTDKMGGAQDKRPGLDKCLRSLRRGDILVIWKLDRLGRSLENLIAICNALNRRGIDFIFLTEAIDTRSPLGRLYFHLMGAFAEFERELIRERAIAGIQAARKKGHIGGRPRCLTTEQVDEVTQRLKAGESISAVARYAGVSRRSIFRYRHSQHEDHSP